MLEEGESIIIISNSSNRMTGEVAAEASSGFRFRPTDEELIVDYLYSAPAKEEEETTKKAERSDVIIHYDVYSCPPWDLPRQLFKYSHLQKDMYFISERQPKAEGGSKVDGNAAGEDQGFWYYNSKRIPIENSYGEMIGVKCSLNYIMFKEDAGCNNNENDDEKKIKEEEKTSWIMHEYSLHESSSSTKFQDVVLCHIYDTAAEDEQPKRVTIIQEEEAQVEAFTYQAEQADHLMLAFDYDFDYDLLNMTAPSSEELDAYLNASD